MQKLKYILSLVLCTLILCPSAYATIGLNELGDSLTALTGFSPAWSAPVRVKNMRINGNNAAIYTNATLSGVRWDKPTIALFQRKVSQWVFGNEKGKITIYTNRQPINELITDCTRGVFNGTKGKDLSDRNIALWPSHGLYYNTARDEWIWQRATLWTTVEDLYSHEYVRLLKPMLENAGATVLMPRAGLEHSELGVSGMPRWTEGARYWIESQGADSALWYLYDGDHYKDDMKSRCMWVNAVHRDSVPIDLCLALHTDGMDSGDDSTIVGTLCIYTPMDDDGKRTLHDGRNRQIVNRNLADWVQTQVTNDLRHIAPEWTRRQLMEANYCESRVPVVPSIILELVSHKNMADMRYGLDPQFRMTAARAIYKGILRYLNGPSAIVQPLPVQQLAISADGVLRWQAPVDSLEPTAVATYYMVYTQANDGEWDVQQVDKQTSIQTELKQGVRYNYYVVAGNDGGLSLPSPIVSAYLSERENAPMALVIDGFDDSYGVEWFADSVHAGIVPGSYACENGFSCAYIGEQWNFTRASEWVNDDNCGWGACYRDHAGQFTVGNTHDWSAQHGRVLRKMRISYVSATAGMADRLLVDANTQPVVVDYVCGRQRMALSATMQDALARYLDQGGHLLLSTDHFSSIDTAFARQYLHASYYAAHATRSGRISGNKHRMYQLLLTPNEEQIFTCTPEALKPANDAEKMATYEDMRCTAAVGWQAVTNESQAPTAKTLVFGFPLEAVLNFEKMYRNAVEWLLQD